MPKLLSVDNLTSGDVKVSPGLLTLPKGQDSFMVTLRTSLEEVATTAPKSVVSLHAPWTVAFQGETVKLICNGLRFNSAQKATWYYWYHEGKMSSKTLSNTHVVHDSGEYRCQASDSLLSNSVRLLFSTANLILQAPLPVFEADSVVLRCRAKAGVAVNNMTLYKNDRFLASLHKTSDFHIHQADMKDSGKYRCSGFKEKCCSVTSNTVNIQVQGVVANVQIHTRPALELVFEGQELVLTCSVVGVPGTVRISWYKGSNKQRMKTKIQNSLNAEFKISMVKNSDAGEYNCEASNGHLILQSKPVTINVKVPVSHPLLTLSPPRDRAFEGDVVRLQCEAQRGSFPIQYEFFHEGVIIKKIETTSWRESSFRFTLTAEHSGNYYCTADNGRGAKQSRAVHLSITIPVSHPVLTLSPPGNRVLEGEMVTLQCEAQRGSLPIQYEFFREGVFIKKIDATLRRTSSFRFTLTTENSGNYHCTADNGRGAQHSTTVHLSTTIPVSHPVLTLSPPGDRVPEGEVMTLNCESQRGSLPIQYQFFREGVILKKIEATSRRTSSFSFSLTTEHSGNYYCTADNGQGAQRSTSVHLSITIPVSRPVLTLRAPRAQTVVGDIVELHCEAQRGSPPILYQFYHEDVTVGNSSAPSGGGSSFKLSLTEEHSGNYACEANNGLGAQRSDTVSLSVTVPVSRPVLTFRAPRAQAVVGDVVELHCETQRGSPPILYRFYHEDVILWISSTHSVGGASFNLSLTREHSGNYSCEAINDLEAQKSKMVTLNVLVPVSRPVLTLRAPGAPAVVGDVVELHCEAQRGSPPILYQFYHENVTVGSSSAPSGGGASFNLSLTAEHSGNYSCEADNGLGAQRSEVVTLSITGATGSRSAPVATGVTGGLLSVMGLAAVALLFYYRLLRKPGGRLTSDSSRNPSNSDPQEPTYHNVPAWIELQPVYSNVNPEGGDVVYSEVRSIQEGKKHAVASTPGLLKNSDSSVIYSQVKVAATPASRPQLSASSAPHR
ncbi:Fc receptor-like protein 5 [Diceros bicornis minor]|uniref:Fc receptor-like protein 5 n=1 Tax=Diceros bicornis minor TaxID=77932 RepID=UPI0026ED35EF|nr:Fc receptor-like protein 5 [Diceros bicornis minor]